MAEDDTSTLPPATQVKRLRRPTAMCQSEGCPSWAWARGYCGSHYQKMKKLGVIKTVRIVGDMNARFDASYEVNPFSGCWEWKGWIHPNGYGVLPVGASGKVRAHRFSYERFVGPIPEGKLVCHSCDVRKCVNPEHLWVGTHQDNIRDCVAKGRDAGAIGKSGKKLTEAMVLNIRIMYARGEHSMQNLADIYGVKQSTISNVVRAGTHLS